VSYAMNPKKNSMIPMKTGSISNLLGGFGSAL
jgi:hypothetical protein